jgi:hypothetical protein
LFPSQRTLRQSDRRPTPNKVATESDFSVDHDGGHGQRHVVHGHHQHVHGPIFKKHRTNLDTLAWYTGRLAIGVFDDAAPGGPIEVLEVNGKPIDKILSSRRSKPTSPAAFAMSTAILRRLIAGELQ